MAGSMHTEWETSTQACQVAIAPSKLAWGLDACLLEPLLGNNASLDRNVLIPEISSVQPFLGQLPGHAGNGGWCAGGPCSQHGRSASEPARCGGAAGFWGGWEGGVQNPLDSNKNRYWNTAFERWTCFATGQICTNLLYKTFFPYVCLIQNAVPYEH